LASGIEPKYTNQLFASSDAHTNDVKNMIAKYEKMSNLSLFGDEGQGDPTFDKIITSGTC
jgi:hypothetical protein